MPDPIASSPVRLAFGSCAAAGAAALAAAALIGLATGTPEIASFGRNLSPMRPDAAVAILCAACGWFALRSTRRDLRAAGYALAVLTAAIAAAPLIEPFVGVRFDIGDQILPEAAIGGPSRMNAATSVALLLAAVTLLFSRSVSARAEDLRQFARLAGLASPVFVLALHAYDHAALNVIRGFEMTPLTTALALVLLLLALGLDRGAGSLRWQVAEIGVVVIAPLAALTVHFASAERELALESAGARLASVARVGAERQDAVVAQGRQMLEFLSRQPRVQRHEQGCGADLIDYLPLNPRVRALFTVGQDGVIRCSGEPGATGMQIGDRDYVKAAFATGEFTVSGYFLARTNGQPRVAMALPFRTDGRLDQLIVAALDLEALGDPLAELAAEGPKGAKMTLVDKSGVVIARHPAGGAPVGANLADAAFVTRALSLPDQPFDAVEFDAEPHIFAARRVLSGEATLIVGLPRSVAVAPVDRRLNHRLLLIIAILLCSLAIGIVGSEAFVLRPLRKLTAYAGRLEAGDLAARPDVRASGEVGALGRALAVTAAATQDREQRLAEAESLFRGLFDHSPDAKAVVRVEPDGGFRVETWNAAAAEATGLSAAEVIGRSPAEVFPGTRGESIEIDLRRTMALGEVLTVEREPVINGLPAVFELVQVPLRGPDGTIERIFLSARDISERKRVERLKNEFVSTVSHELRTPLTSIAGSLGLLAGGAAGELGEKARHLIAIAHSNSLRLVRLINDILDIEKIEAGRMAFDLKALVVSDIVDQAVSGLKPYADEYGVAVEVDHGRDLLMVRGDADRLTQVITNLVSNAIKFSPRGDAVTVSLSADGEIVTISVADRGPGIPEAFRARVFSKFAQADSSDSRRKGGTGLGLAIVKEIVDRHAGAVGYRTEPGRGTIFEVRLPRHAVRERALDAGFAEGAQRSTVLVCEDEPVIASIYAEQMRDAGFAVIVAGGVREALQAMKSSAVDAVLVDLNLPDGDGFGLMRDLRASPKGRRMPIVVVSGDAERRRSDPRASALDVTAWFDKPVDIARLSQTVKKHLRADPARPLVLHVEDDADLRKVVSAAVTPLADVVSVGTVSAARREIERSSFDVAIVDVTLEDGSGLDLLATLSGPRRVPTVIFSANDVDRDIAAHVEASLTKSRTSLSALVDTVRRLIGRRPAGLQEPDALDPETHRARQRV
ncbi:ATP-binding protein [Hansschlegelia sp. KR7-227]|uniref:ATP-binding protein n=1 Tax=Hansschlegelia sp. KR7-227 TaxID=3400914 RepID=UPI003BFE18F0